MTNEKRRLLEKLKLWETPGFFAFIADYMNWYGGDYSDAEAVSDDMKHKYQELLKDLETQESKFKQGKLDL